MLYFLPPKVHFMPEKRPQKSLWTLTPEAVTVLNPPIYLANYRVHLINCNILWDKKYSNQRKINAKIKNNVFYIE